MAVESLVDGSYFTFEDGWEVEKIDEWVEYKGKLDIPPYSARCCDIAAFKDGELWLVEFKDYTYVGASIPHDLAESVGKKVFGSLALLHAVARWGHSEHADFSRRTLTVEKIHVAVAVELPDGGRGLMKVERPLSDIRDKIKPVLKRLGVNRPVVTNSKLPNNVPWTIRRDPDTRARHTDR